MKPDLPTLDLVFGPGTGATPEARAHTSARFFTRTLDLLGEDRPGAAGRRLTAREALATYGFEKLLEVATDGMTALAVTADAAGIPLRTQRTTLGLPEAEVARRAKVTVAEVLACEASKRLPLRTYEKIGRALGLDERYVAVRDKPQGNNHLAVRLRTIGRDTGVLDPRSVSCLAEAAWVATTQNRLTGSLALGANRHGLGSSSNYGTPSFPAFRWGYELAAAVRVALGLSSDGPVDALREIVEERFGIPLIQCDMGESIAGATVEAGSSRAIIVNRSGANHSVYTRRMTVAHELGHLLFDPPEELDALRVDEYDDLSRSAEQVRDRVEQRANAFAAEFLAPRVAVLDYYNAKGDLFDTVGHFGVGATVARHQIRNASRGTASADSQPVPGRNSPEWRQFSAWEGAESFTADLHPIPGIRLSRSGRFGAVVVRAAEEGIVSWDTAAEWMETSETCLRAVADWFHSMYPGVW